LEWSSQIPRWHGPLCTNWCFGPPFRPVRSGWCETWALASASCLSSRAQTWH
ncbi:unnamed protein product, partial [Polarella glacialis]